MDSSLTIGFHELTASQSLESSSRGNALARPNEPTDEILVARILDRDNVAMSLLFQRYASSIRNVGKRILRDDSEADDLVQEVFLYIHRKSELFDRTKGAARSWIIQIAYTQALIRRRQLKSCGFYASGIADAASESRSAIDNGAKYDHTVEGFFGRSGWKTVWNSLSEDQQETFRQHFFDGYTFGEIAERRAQSPANIRHHYYRGLQKLRKHAADNDLNWP